MSRLDADERWHPNADRSQVITMMVRDGKARLVEGVPEVQGDIIAFKDRRVKTICLENWDANGDGELSKEEASVVKSLGGVFKGSYIRAFDELQYFTGLKSIGEEEFCDCENLWTFTLPETIVSIGPRAFKNSHQIKVHIAKNVEEIGDYAFENNTLTSLVIPASVRYIGKNIIKGCNYITHVEVEEDNPYYDSRDGCNAILDTKTDKLIAGHMMSVIPSSTKIIGEEAFCSSFFKNNVTLPTGLVSIEDRAFFCCNLRNLDIPEGVISIGNHAFEGFDYLTSISLPSSIKHIGDSAFKTVSDKVHHVYVSARTPLAIPDVFFGSSDEDYLYVPKGSKAAYMAADYWNHFNVIEMTGVRGDLNFDGKVTVADVMVLIDIIVGRESVFRPVYLCDLNIDNKVTVADVMQMVDMILLK